MTLTAQEFAEQMPDAHELLSDEPQMESSLHYQQLALLVSCLEWYWRDRQDFFIGANLTVYYDHQQLRRRAFLGPDFFLVRAVEHKPRNSWVVWAEGGRYPDLIIELLSDSTAKVDRTSKKTLYQNVFRTPEYFWFSPVSLELVGFRLLLGVYQPITADEQGRYWSEMLGLSLGVEDGWLRYFEQNGDKVLTPAETAEQEYQRVEQAQQQVQHAPQQAQHAQQQAQQAQQQTQQERERANRMAQQLRALGIDPEKE